MKVHEKNKFVKLTPKEQLSLMERCEKHYNVVESPSKASQLCDIYLIFRCVSNKCRERSLWTERTVDESLPIYKMHTIVLSVS